MNKVKEFFSEIISGIPKWQLITICAVCAAVIIAAPAMGFFIPKGSHAVSRGLEALREKDSEYIEAATALEEETQKGAALRKSLSDKQTELEKFHTSQDNLEKITESNSTLEEERNNLLAEVNEKQQRLSALEASASTFANRIITWSSGDYTVGTDVAAGKYMITGVGSIAIARDGKSIANKLLKADGEQFTLSAGDKIHIDGSAKLTPQ